MFESIPIGKIIVADSQREAKKLFSKRSKYGISGVIFDAKIEIPNWTEIQQYQLCDFLPEMNPQTETEDVRLLENDDWVKIGRKFSKDLFRLSMQFNQSTQTRSMRFLKDNALAEPAHRDINAYLGWLHFHLTGLGVKFMSSVGNDMAKIRIFNGGVVDADQLKTLIDDQKVEEITLQPRQAAAFDHNAVHESNMGPRSRVLTFGQ